MEIPVITGERSVGVRTVPEPVPAGEWVVIRVDVAPMCTEYKSYLTGHEADSLGHEAAGEVVAIDPAADPNVAVGDRVVVMPQTGCGRCSLCREGAYIHCQQGAADVPIDGRARFAPYVCAQDWLCIDIPSTLSIRHASLACCGLGPTYAACNRLAVAAPDIVLVSGCGPVGLGGIIHARSRGATVLAIEPNSYRADLASALGATVVDPTDDPVTTIRNRTNGVGVDVAIECTGVSAAQRVAIDATRRRGAIAFVGEGDDLQLHTSDDLLRKGLAVHGIWHYDLGLAPELLALIGEQEAAIETMVTHEYPLSSIETAFETQAAGRTGKVLLSPWMDD